MLQYSSGGKYIILNMFRCWGSVFPYTFVVAAVCAAISAVLNLYYPGGSMAILPGEPGIMRETQAWGGFSFLLGFLIVFRTTQAYNRFWEGTTNAYRMRAEWFDAISSVIAFTKHSTVNEDIIINFRELIIRLCSMIHAAALAELEAGDTDDPVELWAYNYDIIDPDSLDDESLHTIQDCDMKVDLIFQWMCQLIVENIATGVLSIPPPILSRTFQELANGMVAYQDAMKLAYVPFPFPYAQACDGMLLLHWAFVPIITSQWVTNPLWAALLCFIQVFILWSLNLIAIEIDQPYGNDANDIDGCRLQMELNAQLNLLLKDSTLKTPHLIYNPDRERSSTPMNPYTKMRSGGTVGSLGRLLFPRQMKRLERAKTLEYYGESARPFNRMSMARKRVTLSSEDPDGSRRVTMKIGNGRHSEKYAKLLVDFNGGSSFSSSTSRPKSARASAVGSISSLQSFESSATYMSHVDLNTSITNEYQATSSINEPLAARANRTIGRHVSTDTNRRFTKESTVSDACAVNDDVRPEMPKVHGKGPAKVPSIQGKGAARFSIQSETTDSSSYSARATPSTEPTVSIGLPYVQNPSVSEQTSLIASNSNGKSRAPEPPAYDLRDGYTDVRPEMPRVNNKGRFQAHAIAV